MSDSDRTAVGIGGYYHGRRFPVTRQHLILVEPQPLTWQDMRRTVDPTELFPIPLTYRLEKFAVRGSRRTVDAYVHPDIDNEEALGMLWDLLMDCWEKGAG